MGGLGPSVSIFGQSCHNVDLALNVKCSLGVRNNVAKKYYSCGVIEPMCWAAEIRDATAPISGPTHCCSHHPLVTSSSDIHLDAPPDSVAPQEPRPWKCRAISPFVQLAEQVQTSRPAVVLHCKSINKPDHASAAAWTPYQLPETRALLAKQRAAALRLRLSAAYEPASATRLHYSVPQTPLSSELLAAVDSACARTWLDTWVRAHTTLTLSCRHR